MIDPELESLEPAIDPGNRISFLLDWELTMKCNLDCSYCAKGLYGGHDNTTKHPARDRCFETIDFMFEYADIYLSKKLQSLRYVILNVYGGESLHHPDIVSILERVKMVYDRNYASKFRLVVTTTTNAIVSRSILDQLIPLIDEFMVSYHSEASAKQKQMFRDNLLYIRNRGKRLKCILLMHPDFSQDTENMMRWCHENQITVSPKQLDHDPGVKNFNYTKPQIMWFEKFYKEKSFNSEIRIDPKPVGDRYDLGDAGRPCCGGRCLVKNSDHKSRDFFVKNNFTDWYCSVNEFFLHIKQVNGEIFVNKDCKMNFDDGIGPIGDLSRSRDLLDRTRQLLESGSMPIIRCKKDQCICGICAPKAKTLDKFQHIMAKFQA